MIAGILAQESGEAPRPLIGPLVKEVAFDFEKETPEGVVPVPLTIEPQHGIHVWGLVSISVPEKLGEVLFNLYSGPSRTLPSFRRWSGRFHEVEAYIAAGVDELDLPIKDFSASISEVEMTFPILEKRGDQLAFVPRLGSVPLSVHHRVIPAVRENAWHIEDVLRIETRRYQIQARLATGRLLTRHLRINHDALWWSRCFKRGPAGDDA